MTAAIIHLLQPILAKDGWKLDGLIARKSGRQISFFTPGDAPQKLRASARQDRGQFRHIGVVIARTTEEMERLRSVKFANKFPRAFFTSLPLLADCSGGSASRRMDNPALHRAESDETASSPTAATPNIASFDAAIIANLPVGGTPPSHWRLAFKAPGMEDIQPPQFFMMDVRPERTPLGYRAVRRGKWEDGVDWTPQPLLKRPFGICRAYVPHFPVDYLKRLSLPPSLAPALQICRPDHFDMLYKVLPDGIGTPLITQLKRGDKVHMLGPLGNTFDVRQLRAAGVEEVHVIGGGVGMAPLILLVEMLRFYSFRVKVFLGTATVESLRYRDELAATFGEKPRDAYIYVDDLLAAGVKPADIFVACDKQPPKKVRGIPAENLFHGLLPEQYRQYLQRCHPERSEGPRNHGDSEVLRFAQNDNARKVLAFTCGPNRMMEIVSGVAAEAGVPLKVLLEKRMGCGIGVCFSCVCRVRRPAGEVAYARVCKDGPMFDAKDIVWNETDLKPTSAGCGCAARC
jgi:dihydroorotate dehydrogenase electron transfer subunit